MRGRALAHATHTTLGPRGRTVVLSPAGLGGQARGRAAVLMGASMWQTPGAQGREIGQIDSDMRVWDSELRGEAQRRGYLALPIGVTGGADPASVGDVFTTEGRAKIEEALAQSGAPVVQYLPPVGAAAQDPIVKLYYDVWLPFMGRWRAFYAENKDGAWWSNPAAEAEGYQRQLVQMRQTARKLGMHVTSAEPEAFSASLLDPHHDVVDDAGDAAKHAGKMAEYAVYGLLGIGGLLVVTSIVQNVRAGNDPVGRYVSYARGR